MGKIKLEKQKQSLIRAIKKALSLMGPQYDTLGDVYKAPPTHAMRILQRTIKRNKE